MDVRTIPFDWVDHSVWHPLWEYEVQKILAARADSLPTSREVQNCASTIQKQPMVDSARTLALV